MGRVTITLKGKKKPIPEPKKGPILPTDTPEYLPRRLTQQLQLFDMGRKWNGSAFVDIDWTIPTTHTEDEFIVGEYGTDPLSGVELPLAHSDDLRSTIIDYDLADIEDMHPRIGEVEGEYLNFMIGNGLTPVVHTSTDPDWTEKGWKLSAAELATPNFFLRQVGLSRTYSGLPIIHELDDLFFPYIQLSGAGKDRITTEYDYSASVAPYAPKLGDKIFLMPSIVKPDCKVQQYFDPLSISWFHYLSSDWTLTKRGPILDDEADDNYLQPMTVPGVTSFTIPPGDLVYIDMMRVNKYFTDNFANLWSHRYGETISGPVGWETWDPTDFPPSAYYDPINPPLGVPATFHRAVFNIFNADFLAAGSLKAVIKRGSIRFFVWQN